MLFVIKDIWLLKVYFLNYGVWLFNTAVIEKKEEYNKLLMNDLKVDLAEKLYFAIK